MIDQNAELVRQARTDGLPAVYGDGTRTRDARAGGVHLRAIDDLMRLGATEVVVEEFEASLEMFARALESYEIPASRIAHELDAIRQRALRVTAGHGDA